MSPNSKMKPTIRGRGPASKGFQPLRPKTATHLPASSTGATTPETSPSSTTGGSSSSRCIPDALQRSSSALTLIDGDDMEREDAKTRRKETPLMPSLDQSWPAIRPTSSLPLSSQNLEIHTNLAQANEKKLAEEKEPVSQASQPGEGIQEAQQGRKLSQDKVHLPEESREVDSRSSDGSCSLPSGLESPHPSTPIPEVRQGKMADAPVSATPKEATPSSKEPTDDHESRSSMSSLSDLDDRSGRRSTKRKYRSDEEQEGREDEEQDSNSDNGKEEYDKNLTRDGRPRKRTYYGTARMNGRCLAAGDGDAPATGAKWPKKGTNTIAGLMQELRCDRCLGRVHWACAGLETNQEAPDDEWLCPSCGSIGDNAQIKIAKAQQDRCIRSDCIKRLKLRIIREEGDQALYRVLKIIGQKDIPQSGPGRLLHYLVLWEDWDLSDATWEPEGNFKLFETVYFRFDQEAKRHKMDLRKTGVHLLPEARVKWDAKGKLEGKRSERWLKMGWPLGEGAEESEAED